LTALTIPPRAGHDAYRPVPWRRMAWVTWRQHRLALAGVVVVLGGAAAYLLITGHELRSEFPGGLYGEGPGLTLTAALFQVIAPLLGAFLGAPVLARELEAGTFRFTWTQGFGRARWTVATLAPLALAVTVLAGGLGFLFAWCYEPQIGGKYGLSPLMSTTFDLRGVAFAGWTLLGFSIGVLAGILIRRTVPAMFATLAAWSGVAVATGVFLRRHYEAPLVTSNANLPHTDWVMSQWWTRGGKPVSASAINQVLEKVGVQINGSSQSLAKGSVLGRTNMGPVQYLLHHGFTQWMSYQPASRFWPFQWIEGGWLLALSVILMGAAVWRVHRRAV
jgi:hypothetical protein